MEEIGKTNGGFARAIYKFLVIVVIVALSAGGGMYFVKQKPEIFGLSKDAATAQVEADALIAQVGLLIALPTDEKPTVATVTDLEKVKDQPFFKNAKNGDKVLIYTNAKKAILYRPSEKRIIEVNINNQQQDPNATPSAEVVPSSSPVASPVAR
jgi:hypothetical protein